MKLNFFKYIFIVFVIGIMIFAIYKIKTDEENKNKAQVQESGQEKEKITEINLGIAELDTLNPILSKNKNVQDITKIIFEPLVDLTSNYKAEPCLAKEWAKQENAYIIKLRENVKWSNGENFTSADVKYTIDRLKDTNSIYSYNVQDVLGVEIIDNYTLKIILDKEVAFFEYNLTFPIMSSTYFGEELFLSTEKNIAPIGTGKYKISDVQDGYIKLEKNSNWWNIKNKNLTLEKITINKYVTLGELYNAFKIGNIDVVSTENESIQEYIGKIGYNPKELKGREHGFLIFNTQNAILSQTEVRKALSYSIDKENIVSSIFNNSYYTSSFPLDYGTWIYQNQSSSAGYNPEQAKKVLEDSGWIYRNKNWQKTVNYKTQKLALNLLVKASDKTRVAVAENLRNQLANQAITINIVQASDSQYTTMLNNKNFDICLCNMYLSANPSMETFFGDGNFANYINNEAIEILKEVRNTSEEATLKDRYSKLSDIYKNEVPYISLYTNKYNVAYSAGLSGELEPNWFSSFYNIEGWSK